MLFDLTKLKAAAAAHTLETQRLLDASAASAKVFAAAQAEVDALTAEVAAQTAAIKGFNDAAAAPDAPAEPAPEGPHS